MERIIRKVSRLYDVSPVTFPAYPDTSVAKRDLTALEDEKNNALMQAEQERQAEQDAREREEKLRMITLKSK
jgi:phage head maturation protease